MRRVVFDSNAVDPLADRSGAFEAVQAAVQSGALEVLYTHVTIDELVEIPDVDRRATLVLLLTAVGRLVPTGTAAVDFSRVNFCRLGAEEDEDVMEALRSGNIDHTRDALIAATAIFEGCALVTNERRLTNRSRERGIEVFSSNELFAELGFTLDAAPIRSDAA
jgi:predicted nucleic acid-binding protein